MTTYPLSAGEPSATVESAMADCELTVRRAARALSRAGFVHAYGHCSQRLDANRFLVSASKPLGTIGPGENGHVVDIHQPLPEGVLGEVRLHQEIYKRRPEVQGVVRSMPPQVMALSVLGKTPRIVHGMSSYFSPQVALWDDPQLIRNAQAAAQVAETLGAGNAIVMRGNGAVVAGPSLADAVVLTWFLEDAARIELACAANRSEVKLLSPEEADQRAVRTGRIFERMWDYLTHADPE